ncbi:nuclear transport factor 2 family protein [Pseudomonas sp. RIT-PI-S]|uniref:YybH family protein n=1 Tax=Pseudomonas sp. RIT-PI-S TaxID=3035295 RepID=UPI0021DABDCA|nr:nuclear transport factor 2 family protein [Pseudomonas sp. RIT-PI-S]
MDRTQPTPPDSTHRQVLAAAEALVAAFAGNQTDAYFAAFSEDATFVFHTTPEVLENRAAYRQLWDSWQREGFRVLGCQSRNPRVSLQGDVAIFTHDVATHLRLNGQEIESLERETIVFRQTAPNGGWLACHEHLSPMPEPQPQG